jgi:3-phenylpropionate/trans-cinnamate dioxygenase ferredoxin subunit
MGKGQFVSGDDRWVRVAGTDDLGDDDVIEVVVEDLTLALYRTKDGFFATDGICTHELARLCDGFVFGNIIECPKHQGRFDVRSGKAKGAPANIALRTYPLRVVGTDLEVGLGGE